MYERFRFIQHLQFTTKHVLNKKDLCGSREYCPCIHPKLGRHMLSRSSVAAHIIVKQCDNFFVALIKVCKSCNNSGVEANVIFSYPITIIGDTDCIKGLYGEDLFLIQEKMWRRMDSLNRVKPDSSKHVTQEYAHVAKQIQLQESFNLLCNATFGSFTHYDDYLEGFSFYDILKDTSSLKIILSNDFFGFVMGKQVNHRFNTKLSKMDEPTFYTIEGEKKTFNCSVKKMDFCDDTPIYKEYFWLPESNTPYKEYTELLIGKIVVGWVPKINKKITILIKSNFVKNFIINYLGVKVLCDNKKFYVVEGLIGEEGEEYSMDINCSCCVCGSPPDLHTECGNTVCHDCVKYYRGQSKPMRKPSSVHSWCEMVVISMKYWFDNSYKRVPTIIQLLLSGKGNMDDYNSLTKIHRKRSHKLECNLKYILMEDLTIK